MTSARRWWPRAAAVLPLVLTVAATLLAYGGTLHVGFMFDDLFELPWASGRSLLAIFTDASQSRYYRPIPGSIWNLLALALGRHDPLVLHGLVLAIHALNGWLVYLLVRRLVDVPAALLAAALFVWHPHGNQVAIYANGLPNALATAGLLGAVLCYWDARVRADRRAARLCLAAALGVLALFSYENGVVLAALIILVEATLRLAGRAQRISPAPAAFAALTAVFLAIWAAIPRRPAEWSFDPASLGLNALYVLQGVAYPIAALAASLAPQTADARLLAGVAGLVAIVGLAAVLAARARLPVLGFGVAWVAVTALPAVLMLRWEYVATAPRLLYLPAVGIVLVWSAALAPRGRRSAEARPRPPAPFPTRERGAPAQQADTAGTAEGPGEHDFVLTPGLSPPAERGARLWRTGSVHDSPHSPWRGGRGVGSLVGPSFAALVLLGSLRFLLAIGALQAQGQTVIDQLAETATRADSAVGRIYVNVPAWFALTTRPFPLGTWGVTLIPEYLTLGRSVYMHRGVEPELLSIAYLDAAPGWDWDALYGPHGPPLTASALAAVVRRGGGVYVTRFSPGRIALDYAGGVDVAAPAPAEALARFRTAAALVAAAARQADGQAIIDLVWHVQAAGDYAILVQVRDSASRLLVEDRRLSVGGLLPAWEWPPGARVRDRRTLALPVDAGADWQAHIALIDRASGARLPALDGRGRPLPGDAVAVVPAR